ncbi:MAG: thrombospondin type 3 repeat-containing protein [Myxococcota bacterium]
MKFVVSIAGMALAALAFTPATALAGECSAGFCGTPDQSGGGCGCGGGSILVAMTDRGDTYQFADDQDGDGVEDDFDNCPFLSNFDQVDQDGDGTGNACDLCAATPDVDQSDIDGDGLGDACDNDIDGDGALNSDDNCERIPNFRQDDTDENGVGNVCDDDDDGDGIPDLEDDCRLLAGNPIDRGGCETDEDEDGIDTAVDNCPGIGNTEQLDQDGDGLGDACDIDLDGDGFFNFEDNCRTVFNPSQIDADGDGLGDAGNWNGIGETCDTQECYAFGQEAGNCLNPDRAFDIAILVPRAVDLLTGDRIDLQMFTNRLGELHNWTARFEEIPDGSSVSLLNAQGSATTLARGQVASCLRQASDGLCDELNSIAFNADEPGRYVVKVTATLANGDDQGPATATALVVAEVEGESQGGGCAAGGASGLGALAAGMMLAGLRRRRRQR